MHVDLYTADQDVADAAGELLALLKQSGVPAQTSIVIGGLTCQVSTETFDAFLQALQHWTAQGPGRYAQPNQFTLRELQGKDTSATLTVHPSQAAATAS